MSTQKLSQLQGNDPTWEAYMEASYNKAKEDHSSSYKSWFKTRWRSGNRGASAKVATEGTVGMAGVGIGAATLGGATIPGAVAGASALTGAAALGPIALAAIPAIVTIGGMAYWGYSKNKRNNVNQEIRDWWYRNCPDRIINKRVEVSLETAKKWLGWFGDDGIDNMNHLGQKLKEAHDSFRKKFADIDKRRVSLQNQIRTTHGMPAPQNVQAKAKDERDLEKLAADYLELGEALQYIKYRFERYVMYPQMLEIALHWWLHHEDPSKNTQPVKEGMEGFSADMKRQLDGILALKSLIQQAPAAATGPGRPAPPRRSPPPVPPRRGR